MFRAFAEQGRTGKAMNVHEGRDKYWKGFTHGMFIGAAMVLMICYLILTWVAP